MSDLISKGEMFDSIVEIKQEEEFSFIEHNISEYDSENGKYLYNDVKFISYWIICLLYAHLLSEAY